ncbi:MAG: hypothetical protein CR982_08865 [Candidatus Cloacimonadota bacterium]|nr:MAG: hypothetical protein CR982_08865 [Candidatus Cloacimonadota bacterium]PIE77745.1 MAG: hypothetical protein CSA15_11520 [Candidatus Delongbacteria bacterium]
MQINKVLGIRNIQFEKTAPTNKSSEKGKSSAIDKSDNLKLSIDGERLHKLSVKTNDLINQIDRIESQKLESIKNRLNSGYYNNDLVIDKMATNMLKQDSLKEVLLEDEKDRLLENTIDNKREREDKIEIIKEGIDNNRYENDKVYNKVAKRVIDIYT